MGKMGKKMRPWSVCARACLNECVLSKSEKREKGGGEKTFERQMTLCRVRRKCSPLFLRNSDKGDSLFSITAYGLLAKYVRVNLWITAV